jgi:Glutathione S-transferase, C-terminal domain
MTSLIELGKELHVSVRYVSFHWGLGRMGRIGRDGEARIAELERADSPEKLLDFYRRYNSDTIDEDTYLHHLRALESGWGAQDRRLAGDRRLFLTGNTLSRADILWAAKVLRIFECGYPFAQRFPALNGWFERVKARPAFHAGVLGPNLAMHRFFRVKSAVARMLGGGLGRVAGRGSNLFRVLHPSRDVALALQHTPDIDMVRVLDVEDEIGIARQRPESQSGQIQLMGVTRRAGRRMSADVHIGTLQGVDEAQRGSLSVFGHVVRKCILDIL